MTRRMGLEWLPLILVSTLGFSGTPSLPVWLAGANEQFDLTAFQSGMLASLELGCVASASIASAALSLSSRNRVVLVLAVVLSIAGNLGSFLAADALTLTATRVVVGTSYGLMLADITRRTAQMPDSHRIFAIQQFGLVSFASVFFSTTPMAITSFGPSSPFLYNIALGALALASIMWLSSPTNASDAGGSVAGSAASPGPRASAAVALALVAIALSFMAQASVWTYIAAAAENSGLRLEALARILAIGAIINVLAPIPAERMGLRWGRAAPLLLGYVGLALSILMVALGLGPSWFTAGAIGLNLFLLFLVPFLLGLLAGLDASGRSASAGPAFFMIGGAIGPAVGGLVIGVAGFAMLGAIGAMAVACALALALAAGSRIPSASASADPPAWSPTADS